LAKPVAVPDERSAQYAGLYWKDDDERALRVLHKDGMLFLSESEEERLEFSPLSRQSFSAGRLSGGVYVPSGRGRCALM